MSGGTTGAPVPGTGAPPPPGWVRALVDGAPRAAQELAVLSRQGGPAGRREGRAAAVLVCLSPGRAGACGERGGDPLPADEHPGAGDVLVLERAAGLSSHAGQPALPGGAVDAGDDGPVGAALREAQEETGLAVGGVRVLATMPVLRVPPEGFAVTPVLAWEPAPSPVGPGDPAEVVRVLRVPWCSCSTRGGGSGWSGSGGSRGRTGAPAPGSAARAPGSR